MSNFTAIADLGESLVKLLFKELNGDPETQSMFSGESAISLESPFDLQTSSDVHLSIYLFRILEDPNTKNGPLLQGNGGRIRKRPLTLDLHYLITPMMASKPKEQQIVLGKIMQVLYDRAILQGSDLVPALAAADNEVRIVLNPVALDEISRVWWAMEMSYRLSVCYVARIAIIDSKVEQAFTPVLSKRGDYGEA